VVGGGIVGLAVARELGLRHPHARVCVLEREPGLARHQSSHNSGVLHTGIYYAPGSLKARLCVQGAAELSQYCALRGIPLRRAGKLIVAGKQQELARLRELERRGRANGVRGLRMLGASALKDVEPHAVGLAALHSPETAVLDYAAVARAFAADVLAGGGRVVGGCEVSAVLDRSRTLTLMHSGGSTVASHAVFCAGAWADRLAVAAGASPNPRIVPFRGAYLRLTPEHSSLVRSLIYPVPDPALPFLGVHLTRSIHDEVLVGPTALIAGARDAYRLGDVRASDLRQTLTWPGTWLMAARWWRSGVTEIRQAVQPSLLTAAAARYVPALAGADLSPAFAGIRAQALDRRGRLLDDFAFSATPRSLHVRNAPSPAATASMAIARHVAVEAARSFGLD